MLTIINKCKGVNFDFLFIILKKENKVVKGLIGKDEFHLRIDVSYDALHEFPLNINSDIKVNNDEKED